MWSVAAPTAAASLIVAGGPWTSMGWSGGVGMIAASVLLLDLVGVRSSWMLFTALLRQRQT